MATTLQVLKLLGRFGLSLSIAVVLLVGATLAAFFVLGYAFGFSGHPAVPDLPAGCYTAYLIGAPVLALAVGLWWGFRGGRRRRPGA